MKTNSHLKTLLSKKECAEYLGVSLTTLHNWKINGNLSPRAIGGRVFYLLEDIEKALVQLQPDKPIGGD